MLRAGISSFSVRTRDVLLDHGNGLLDSIKGGEFLGQLSNCWSLKDSPAWCPLVFRLSVSVLARSITHCGKIFLMLLMAGGEANS